MNFKKLSFFTLSLMSKVSPMSNITEGSPAGVTIKSSSDKKEPVVNLIKNIGESDSMSAKLLSNFNLSEDLVLDITDVSNFPLEITNGQNPDALAMVMGENEDEYTIYMNDDLLKTRDGKFERNENMIKNLVVHELTHLSFYKNHINNDSCNTEQDGHPYCNESEKKLYIDALGEFNSNISQLEERLSNALKTGDPSYLLKKDEKIVELINKPLPIVSPNNKESSREIISKELTGFPKYLTASPKYLDEPKIVGEYSNGEPAYLKTIDLNNPFAQSLLVISSYNRNLSVYPEDKQHVEQPAYILQHFEDALDLISPKMHEFMSKALNIENIPDKAKESEKNLFQKLVSDSLPTRGVFG